MQNTTLKYYQRKRYNKITELPLLLDGISGAIAVFSFRKLKSLYSGFCIRVRRSSDNAEQDFGFVNNVLDTSALLSFVGSGSGFVSKWYDQSGNALHAAQNTAASQPRIVNNGVLETINSASALSFDGSNDLLSLGTPASLSFAGSTPFSIVAKGIKFADLSVNRPVIGKWTDYQEQYTFSTRTTDNKIIFATRTSDQNFRVVSAGNNSANTNDIYSFLCIRDSQGIKLFNANNVQLASADFATGILSSSAPVYLGHDTKTYHSGFIKEIIVFNKALSESERAMVLS